METLHFNICIAAPAAKVWDTLWNDASYRQWSSIFAKGSHIRGDLAEGNRIRFMDGSGSGVFGIVCKKVPNKFMSFMNLGELFMEREQVVDERSSSLEWCGAIENYMLHEKKGETRLWVEMEVDKSDAPLFAEKFPVALQKIKAMAEDSAFEMLVEHNQPALLKRAG